MYDDISIVGITDIESYPNGSCKKYFKQCIENDTLRIPPQKPCVESINEINVSICLNDVKVIKTILGHKLIIHGTKKIKIMYTARNPEQSVHSAHWSISFCEFILLDGLCFEKCHENIRDIFIGVEDVFVENVSSRYIDICVLFIICPSIRPSVPCHNYDCKPGNISNCKQSDTFNNNDRYYKNCITNYDSYGD